MFVLNIFTFVVATTQYFTLVFIHELHYNSVKITDLIIQMDVWVRTLNVCSNIGLSRKYVYIYLQWAVIKELHYPYEFLLFKGNSHPHFGPYSQHDFKPRLILTIFQLAIKSIRKSEN